MHLSVHHSIHQSGVLKSLSEKKQRLKIHFLPSDTQKSSKIVWNHWTVTAIKFCVALKCSDIIMCILYNRVIRNNSNLGHVSTIGQHNGPISQIPECTCSISQNAHFCYEWSILGYGTGAFWDFWLRSITALWWPKHDRQATGLDAWASREKCPARFVSHLHDICIYMRFFYSFCLFCCLFIIVTTQFVALYKPCKPKPKPSTYYPPPLAEIQRLIFRPVEVNCNYYVHPNLTDI